jgi:hypothetical protein
MILLLYSLSFRGVSPTLSAMQRLLSIALVLLALLAVIGCESTGSGFSK